MVCSLYYYKVVTMYIGHWTHIVAKMRFVFNFKIVFVNVTINACITYYQFSFFPYALTDTTKELMLN